MQHFLADLSVTTGLLLLGALLLAFGFEAINGFHDTANAVATVIYTHTLKPWHAVVWSGFGTLPAFWSRAARSRSASLRCCPSNW